jgi:hypothetical protein
MASIIKINIMDQNPQDQGNNNENTTNNNTNEQTTQANNDSNGSQNNDQPKGAQGSSEPGQKAASEEFKVNGDEVVQKIKQIIEAGNARRIILKNEEGKIMLEIPLTWGIVGAALLPIWAAVGALAALVAKMTIVVEKRN